MRDTVIARTVDLLQSKSHELGLDNVFARQSGRQQEKQDRAEKQPRELSRKFALCDTKGGKQC